jgi:hypothetical protein
MYHLAALPISTNQCTKDCLVTCLRDATYLSALEMSICSTNIHYGTVMYLILADPFTHSECVQGDQILRISANRVIVCFFALGEDFFNYKRSPSFGLL